MKTRIALCQLNPVVNQPEKNLLTIESVLKDCSRKRVKLCVFPEDFLYGVIRGKENIQLAGEKFSQWIEVFGKLSKKYRVNLVPGSLPLLEQGNLYNTAVYINSQGKLVHIYRKTNLWLSERSDYKPSSYYPQSFQSVLGKTMLIICWDLLNHQLFEAAIKQNVKWIIIVAFWSSNYSKDSAKERGVPTGTYLGNGDGGFIDSVVRARVYEYNVGIVFCNFSKINKYPGKYGEDDLAISAGHSQIVIPLFQVLKKLNNKRDNILICDIPTISKFIKDYEIFYGRREDICNL